MNTGSNSFTIEISDLTALKNFAARLAGVLRPGDVLGLTGPMGAGKTTLIQALGQDMGINEKIVSPTFVLIHDYRSGRYPLVHVDLYRLGPETAHSIADEVLSIIEEGRSLVAVEWVDYGAFLTPLVTINLTISTTGEQSREVRVTTNCLDRRPDIQNALQQGVTQ